MRISLLIQMNRRKEKRKKKIVKRKENETTKAFNDDASIKTTDK